ncbi:MAG: hypothetical protein KF796_08670 [Ramlibacter sp.]|nr:hypothetical protein [Ramlibacter sp.]
MPGGFSSLNPDPPFVVEDGHKRSLHFSYGEIQSGMRTDRPDQLQVDYTRTMMGFLLLQPRPATIGMVGLGGGSLAKFCHRHLAPARILVAENNPGVLALRRRFLIPDDDERLSVALADGAAWVRLQRGRLDALLVDGFDRSGQPEALCSQAFYDDCWQALAPGGVLVVNLHTDHGAHPAFCARLLRSFGGNAMQVVTRDHSNCLVFAARGRDVTLQALRSTGWADALAPEAQRQLRGEFAHIGWNAAAVRAASDGLSGG